MLSNEQMGIIEDNYKLVGWFIGKFIYPSHAMYDNGSFDYGDWTGLISHSLIKAVKSYDSSRGAITTYFTKIAMNDYLTYIDKEDIDCFASTDNNYGDNDDDFGGLDDELMYALEDYSEHLDTLDDVEAEIVELLLIGHTQASIARELRVTRQAINQRVHRLREKLGPLQERLLDNLDG